ncbi:phosphatidylserine decarboxylase [Auriculariales sp. MPI-PUGE-AT-0066]|nr:phosphatidylserine decarboxylase [Auriculariales sp. MPI-PUGE-AT-0066]
MLALRSAASRPRTPLVVSAQASRTWLVTHSTRTFTTTRRHDDEQKQNEHLPLRKRLAQAWRETPIKWSPLPIGIGALLLVALNFRKQRQRDAGPVVDGDGQLRGRWGQYVLGALPLRSLSRLWGYMNGLTLPVWFRPYGFRLYAWIFGCNLSADELKEPDLTKYSSLGEFFYRELKDGARPIAETALVSPADGRVLHFGTVEGARVEQVKGITYSLDALLGGLNPDAPESIRFASERARVVSDEQFADLNGISYSLDDFIGKRSHARSIEGDVSVPEESSSVTKQVGIASKLGLTAIFGGKEKPTAQSALYFAVIYLAPGDYHRFHSPAAWVAERRRHFTGELFSVSPFLARRLTDLFVLNERVALLGRWRYGFFSMIPVGATNVGSIVINFDQALRTNVRGRLPPPGTFREASYEGASSLLKGQPLAPGDEMGGFKLGSTVVLVFEGPKDWSWRINAGEKVRVGQMLGDRIEVLEKLEQMQPTGSRGSAK